MLNVTCLALTGTFEYFQVMRTLSVTVMSCSKSKMFTMGDVATTSDSVYARRWSRSSEGLSRSLEVMLLLLVHALGTLSTMNW